MIYTEQDEQEKPEGYEQEQQESKTSMKDKTGRQSIGIDRVDDLPCHKVKRTDGLPTVDEIAQMLGVPSPKQEETAGEKVSNMVEIILKIR